MALIATNGLGDILARARRASRESGVSIIRQISDSLRLRFGESAIGFSEYFGYRLFDPRSVSRENLETFVSEAVTQQIWEGLNPKDIWGLASDKVTYHTIMVAAGYTQPKLLAFLDLGGRIAPGINSFSQTEPLLTFLRSCDGYPIFCKPTGGVRSRGALGLARHDRGSDSFLLTNGEMMPTQQFVDTLSEHRSYLIQEFVKPDQSISDITGSSLSTLRLVILVKKDGPELFRARWKIPTRGNMADNFWRLGNFLADLDPQSGKVSMILESVPTGYQIVPSEDPIAQRFLGEVAPQYEEALQICLQASKVFSMFTYQSWDIALTASGPLALELNHNGDVELLQLGAKVGIYDEQFKSLLREQKLKLTNRRTKYFGSAR